MSTDYVKYWRIWQEEFGISLHHTCGAGDNKEPESTEDFVVNLSGKGYGIEQERIVRRGRAANREPFARLPKIEA